MVASVLVAKIPLAPPALSGSRAMECSSMTADITVKAADQS